MNPPDDFRVLVPYEDWEKCAHVFRLPELTLMITRVYLTLFWHHQRDEGPKALNEADQTRWDGNLAYLAAYGLRLCEEYTKRTNAEHPDEAAIQESFELETDADCYTMGKPHFMNERFFESDRETLMYHNPVYYEKMYEIIGAE